MPGGRNKIGPDDGVETRFKPGKSGNPKGQRVKVFSQIAKEYKDRGIERATPEVVKEAFEFLMALPVSEITEIGGDLKVENDLPSLLRLMSRDMLGKQSLAAIKDMLNRAHGTPAPKDDSVTHLHVTFDDDMEAPKMSLKKETNQEGE